MSATAELTEEKVLEVLKTVRFPGLTRDIVSFGFVKDLTVGGGNVAFRLEIVTESPRAAEEIKRDATEKLRSLPGVNALTIRLDVHAPRPAAPRRAAGVPPRHEPSLQEVRFTGDGAAGRLVDRRAQGTGGVSEGQRAGARDRREHVVLHLPAMRPPRGDLQARRRPPDRRAAEGPFPGGDPSGSQGRDWRGRGRA